MGEPGIGKTRLLAELAARADARGQLVLSGSASELERDLPFWVFVDALDEYAEGLDPRRLEQLDATARTELAHVFPSLSALGKGGGVVALQDERYRTHRAVRDLLETLAAGKPLVLILDDLHWADSGTIELLGALLRRLPSAPGAARDGDAPATDAEPSRGCLRAGAPGRQAHAPRARRSDAAGDPAAARRRLRRYSRRPRSYEDSGGNPFYLEQLARSWIVHPAPPPRPPRSLSRPPEFRPPSSPR